MNPFAPIIGNEPIKQYLTRMVATKAIGNSLLFAGPDGVGKSLFAHAFAKQLICSENPQHLHKIEAGNHPDIRVYRPEGKIGMHSIASLRQLSEEVYLAPYEAKWKIFIIHDAERMLTYSANALLKTFEEPSLDSVIILLSSQPTTLLPTVLSRCRAIYFGGLSDSEITQFLEEKGKSAEEAQQIAPLAQGSIGKAWRIMQGENRQLRQKILSQLAKGPTNDYQFLHQFSKEIAEHIEQLKTELETEVRASLLAGLNQQDLSALQKQSLEKEIEGAMSMRQLAEAQSFFNIILGWYRDLNLLRVNGNPAYLIHCDFASEAEQALQRGEILSIEKVEKAISEARLSLERSTTLSLCVENLLLKLS